MPIPNPVSRLQLGRDEVHMTRRVTEPCNSGKDLLANEITFLSSVENEPVRVENTQVHVVNLQQVVN